MELNKMTNNDENLTCEYCQTCQKRVKISVTEDLHKGKRALDVICERCYYEETCI